MELDDFMSNLTPREKQICEVLKQKPGLTFNGVGRELGLTRDGVTYHLRNVYSKTGVNNKSALVATLCRGEKEQPR